MEWNLNDAMNISKIGNYKYRKTDPQYSTPYGQFDSTDTGRYYDNGTNADAVITGGNDSNNDPIFFTKKKIKEQLYYSLEDCLGRFRPRSGINKLRYFDKAGQILQIGQSMSEDVSIIEKRPRYYASDKDDIFKYWTSYKTEWDTTEKVLATRGYSSSTASIDGGYAIDDVAPFVVYKNSIAANKIVIKMQTNVGSVNLGVLKTSSGKVVNDPFYGDTNKTVPKKWKLQKLHGTDWTDIVDYTNMPTDIAEDGYVEFSFGLQVPDQYKDIFVFAGELSSTAALPETSYLGYAYLIKSSNTDIGAFHIWTNEDYNNPYEIFTPTYSWLPSSQTISSRTIYLTDPIKANSSYTQSGIDKFRQFEYLDGIRIVVDEMNTPNSTFDLIEMSPRLFMNVSDRVQSYDITKPASDLSGAGLPVSKMMAGTGTISMFDFDQAFSENNLDSIIYGLRTRNIQFKFYESIFDVDNNGTLYDYHVPIKTMYSDDAPKLNSSTRDLVIQLRDLSILLETTIAPQMMMVNKPLLYIISRLLDSIGFSNYRFYATKINNDIIPYFFIGPDTNVSQILEQLAVSTQSAMFFDEQNNFVVMTRDYMMPAANDREVNLTIDASSNIVDIASSDTTIFNSGKITYSNKYIQKTYGSVAQSSYGLKAKNWIYKPSLLWEVSPESNLNPTNGETSAQSAYTLSAIPLSGSRTDGIGLSKTLPTVNSLGTVVDNIIEFGDGIQFISKYAGYFYANGEVIRYDAVEFSISGPTGTASLIWISNPKDFEYYFAKLTLGQRIYPTGRVRIYSEPAVNSDGSYKVGDVAKHGRGQFGTEIVDHYYGLSSTWTNPNNLKGCFMDSELLLSGGTTTVSNANGKAGIESSNKNNTTISSVIKNVFTTTDESIPATVQASALVMNGPSFSSSQNPIDYVSYVYKQLPTRYTHFGTRTRIVGSVGNGSGYDQQPVGNSTMYSLKETTYPKTITNSDGTTTTINVTSKAQVLGGSSGGVAILIDPTTNNGYYFEIAALTNNNVNNYSGTVPINNMFFYKLQRNGTATSDADKAIPNVLWSGLAPILVDDGKFTGQSRLMNETSPTVYDIAVEYERVSNTTKKFYLFVNGQVVGTVEDKDALPENNSSTTNVALFTRGSSRLMFENVYGLVKNYSQTNDSLLDVPIGNDTAKAFGFGSNYTGHISVTDSFRKYAMSGMINGSYLSGIGAQSDPAYSIFYDEFGTIMRECAYMNVRFDKAYPALYSVVSPTFNSLKGYTISGFKSTPYGAEFLIFNNTDTLLTLDESSGNYLRIQGVAFTQQTQNELTVDQFFLKNSDFSNFKLSAKEELKNKKTYDDIKASRMTYGKKEFTLDTPYIQSEDLANKLMSWVTQKVMRPRKSVGVELFGMPILQLGDIIKIDYQVNGVDEAVSPDSKFVVYNIQYSKGLDGIKNTVYLSEVGGV
jgi:hypothetical protein